MGSSLPPFLQFDRTIGKLTYDATVWEDRLTGYNNGTITYDTIDNPTSYLGATLTWRGRELSSYSKDGKQISYSYDVDGMRYQKIVKTSGVETARYDYVYSDGKLILLTYTSNGTANTARFIYDSFGEPRGFILNNSSAYLYLKNGQGDITAIVDESGEILVRYTYNAWGAVEFIVPFGIDPAVTTVLATVSPFTYRGYCYDFDLGLYYLQSRYYDPEICRFINADSTDYLGATGTLLSYNLFAYCENDPVDYVDPSGEWGADIHYGKKYANKELVNNKGVFKKYNGTYEWLNELKIKSSYRTIIAKACKDVDVNLATSPINPLGWKYHFNKSSKNDDRLKVAGEILEKAVKNFKKAKKESDKKKALELLGRGLHAVQDYSAHGNFWPIEEVRSVGNVSYVVVVHSSNYDDPYYNWANSNRISFSKKLSYLGNRYTETYRSTLLYVSVFLVGIGNNAKSLLNV